MPELTNTTSLLLIETTYVLNFLICHPVVFVIISRKYTKNKLDLSYKCKTISLT